MEKTTELQTYERMKKRVNTYRRHSNISQFFLFFFGIASVFSLLPVIPAFIWSYIRLDPVWTWLLCLAAFGFPFYGIIRLSNRIESTEGVTLEEMLYVDIHEVLNALGEYRDPQHPVKGGKRKAALKLRSIYNLLGRTKWEIPRIAAIREGAESIGKFKNGIIRRIVPSIEGQNEENLKKAYEVLQLYRQYFLSLQFSDLVNANNELDKIPYAPKRNIFETVHTMLSQLGKQNLFAVLVIAACSLGVYEVDTNLMNATGHEAFALLVTTFLGGLAIYVAYLKLKSHK